MLILRGATKKPNSILSFSFFIRGFQGTSLAPTKSWGGVLGYSPQNQAVFFFKVHQRAPMIAQPYGCGEPSLQSFSYP